jgi:hypothetical protein
MGTKDASDIMEMLNSGTVSTPNDKFTIPSNKQMPAGKKPQVDPVPKATPDDAKNLKMQKLAKGGMTASKRADGIAQRGKTKGRIV